MGEEEATSTMQAVEALLFASGEEGLTPKQLADLLQCSLKTIEMAISLLQQACMAQHRGIVLVQRAQQYVMVTAPSCAAWVAQLAHVPRRTPLSQAALETLAIVAAKQPVTKAEMEALRGVSVERPLKKLLEKQLIEEAGRADVLGRPLLYRTTIAFLHYFGLTSLEDMPTLDALQDEPYDEMLIEE
jgi:segregation and condensation protein B